MSNLNNKTQYMVIFKHFITQYVAYRISISEFSDNLLTWHESLLTKIRRSKGRHVQQPGIYRLYTLSLFDDRFLTPTSRL